MEEPELLKELELEAIEEVDEELEVNGVVSSCNVGKSSESKAVTDFIPLLVFNEFIIIKKYIIKFFIKFKYLFIYMKSNTKSKRNYKLSKIQRNKKHLTKKNKRYNKYKKYKGGHPNEDLEHYHLHIKLPSGATKEIPERFLHTTKDRGTKAVTIRDIQDFVVDQIGRIHILFYLN